MHLADTARYLKSIFWVAQKYKTKTKSENCNDETCMKLIWMIIIIFYVTPEYHWSNRYNIEYKTKIYVNIPSLSALELVVNTSSILGWLSSRFTIPLPWGMSLLKVFTTTLVSRFYRKILIDDLIVSCIRWRTIFCKKIKSSWM